MKESWRNIPGYDGKYQADMNGKRSKSLQIRKDKTNDRISQENRQR